MSEKSSAPPSPAPDTCYLYLLRHGATANNLQKPPHLQGRRADVPLDPVGHRQAEAAGEFLARYRLDAVYTSPLLRTRQTAAAIAHPHALTPVVIDDLIECDVGDWEGRAWPEIEQNDHEAWRLFREDPIVHPYGGGENMAQVEARIEPVFAKLLEQHRGQAITVVAHNVVNRIYLALRLGWPLARCREILQNNAGINLISYRDGKATVLTVNSVFHLPQW